MNLIRPVVEELTVADEQRKELETRILKVIKILVVSY